MCMAMKVVEYHELPLSAYIFFIFLQLPYFHHHQKNSEMNHVNDHFLNRVIKKRAPIEIFILLHFSSKCLITKIV